MRPGSGLEFLYHRVPIYILYLSLLCVASVQPQGVPSAKTLALRTSCPSVYAGRGRVAAAVLPAFQRKCRCNETCYGSSALECPPFAVSHM